MPHLLWVFLTTALVVWVPQAPAAPRPDRCTRNMIGMAGLEADRAVACEAARARTGRGSETSCGANAFAALEEALRLGRARCGTPELVAGGRTLITDLLADLRPIMHPGDGQSRCAAAKLRAAGRHARRALRCAARAAATGDENRADACRAHAVARLERAFAGAEQHADCLTHDDLAFVTERIDDLAASFAALIAAEPPLPPADLQAAVAGADVVLTWTAPPLGSAAGVRLLRRRDAPPAGPTDGDATLLHAGPGTTFSDAVAALLPGTYHYAVFGCTAAGSCEQTGSRTQHALTLIEALRGGGYVLHWRHASANVCADRTDLGPAATTTYPGWWKRCDAECSTTATARQMSALGVTEATAIGETFRRLGIPVGRVVSSEFCRNVGTAELMAFGPPIEQAPGITFFAYDEANRCASTQALLAEPPAPGGNTALIGHAGFTCPVLDQLTWSEAAIYRPDGAGGADLVARVLWDGWDASP